MTVNRISRCFIRTTNRIKTVETTTTKKAVKQFKGTALAIFGNPSLYFLQADLSPLFWRSTNDKIPPIYSLVCIHVRSSAGSLFLSLFRSRLIFKTSKKINRNEKKCIPFSLVPFLLTRTVPINSS